MSGSISGWNSMYYCQYQAILNGAYYFALSFDHLCFFGSIITNITQYGVLPNEGYCGNPCSTNDSVIPGAYIGPDCGGFNRENSVYQTLVSIIVDVL